MIKITDTLPPITTKLLAQLTDAEIEEGIFMVENATGRIYYLTHEKKGYIFRDINNHAYGHSGYSQTKREAIRNSLDFIATPNMMMFHSLMEAIDIIKAMKNER
jgi:hypothetical protein